MPWAPCPCWSSCCQKPWLSDCCFSCENCWSKVSATSWWKSPLLCPLRFPHCYIWPSGNCLPTQSLSNKLILWTWMIENEYLTALQFICLCTLFICSFMNCMLASCYFCRVHVSMHFVSTAQEAIPYAICKSSVSIHTYAHIQRQICNWKFPDGLLIFAFNFIKVIYIWYFEVPFWRLRLLSWHKLLLLNEIFTIATLTDC